MEGGEPFRPTPGTDLAAGRRSPPGPRRYESVFASVTKPRSSKAAQAKLCQCKTLRAGSQRSHLLTEEPIKPAEP